MSKYTPWFAKESRPARRGWYQRDYGRSDRMTLSAPDYWTGSVWLLGSVEGSKNGKALTQDRRWRGLAKEPK